ncbi:winged helix-turn-helix domain-containing protein [Streptomyces lunaelactis]|uniref:AfsR/SARP family transcriptional regulator n=1 Tax=Streptomyces lunaelactis TaxID=1535768 RepID=UPI00158581E6|nr:AfsR/SARP family transcriptional regulator [Streptomyces lunaelactis]NUK10793.1 winged helix-turn-helix domain-containing protein [Streptomyces lunaelactis]NUL10153.1 winged helix-turn-helix domain-containing protein [Streptomyces lunaelactis]NUL25510.1 winged helix-turn-helix domain-containing protein [Streptomyces lunaelactis]
MVATRGDHRIELGSPTQRTVFAVLAANENRVVSRHELVRAVWGSDASETVMNSVYTYIARLRKCLEPSRAQPEVLVSDSLGYMLSVPAERVDTRRFSTALSAARRLRAENDTERAAAKLEEGLALWRGTPYAGTVGTFVASERIRLAETRLLAIEDHAELLLELNRPAHAIGELSALVHRYPLRERLRLLLMRCHVELGQHADAIGEYHALRTRLAEDQGIEPGESLRELYEQVLQAGRPSTPRPARRESAAAAPRADKGDGGRRADGAANIFVPSQRTASTVRQLPRSTGWFIGRTAELGCLEAMVAQADEAGESALLLLTGSPGVGKTTLATQFARTLAGRFADSQYHLDLRAFSASSAPRSASFALRRLNATLGGRPAAPGLDSETEYRSRVADREMLLILDNATSVEQVRPLLPGTPASLVIVTSRWGLSGLIAQDGARRFVVEPLNRADALLLFTGIVGESLVARHRDEVEHLIEACEGLPLALRIAATQIKISPFPRGAVERLRTDDLSTALALPGDANSTLSTVFGWSYSGLPAEAALMYRTLGHRPSPEISLTAAATLSGMGAADSRRALDVLVDASLLREVAPDRFRMGALLHAHARRVAEAATGNVQGRSAGAGGGVSPG